ncbi:MAG: hypothetical protein V4489_09580 [Chlamydiota bacterium]
MTTGVGSQPEGASAQTTVQTGKVAETAPTSQNSANAVASATTLQTLLATTAATTDAYNSGSASTQSSDDTTPTGSGLSESQVVTGDPSSRDGGQGGSQGGDRNFEEAPLGNQNPLVSSGVLDTSVASNTAASVEKKSAELLSENLKAINSSAVFEPKLDTAKLVNCFSQLAPNFTTLATSLGIPPADIEQVTPHLDNITKSAQILDTISNAGASSIATQNVIASIHNDFNQACTVIATSFAQNPDILKGLLMETKGMSEDAATTTANGFADMVNNYSSFTDAVLGKTKPESTSNTTATTTSSNPLDSSSYETTEDAVGSFAGGATLNLGLLDAFSALTFGFNAEIGSETATESEATNANTLSEIHKQEKEQKKEKKEAKTGGLVHKIFTPVQSAAKIAVPIMTKVISVAVAGAVNTVAEAGGHKGPVVSSKQVEGTINHARSTIMKDIQIPANYIKKDVADPIIYADNYVTKNIVLGIVDVLADMFPNVDKSEATAILTPIVAFICLNPLLAVQSFNSLLEQAIFELCMTINPNLDRSTVQMGVDIAVQTAEMIAITVFCSCCGAPEAAAEVDEAGIAEDTTLIEGDVAADSSEASETMAEEEAVEQSGNQPTSDNEKTSKGDKAKDASATENTSQADNTANKAGKIDDDSEADMNQRDAVSEGDDTEADGAKTDAAEASKAGPEADAKVVDAADVTKGTNYMPSLNTIMKVTMTYQAIGTMATSAITIAQQLSMIQIAECQASIAIDKAILQILDYTMNSANANTSNAGQGVSGNVSGIANANATMSQTSASSTTMDFPA